MSFYLTDFFYGVKSIIEHKIKGENMENKIKLDFTNKIIEVEGDTDFINEKIEWFTKVVGTAKSCISQANVLVNSDVNSNDDIALRLFGVSFSELGYIVHIKEDGEFDFILPNKKLKGGHAEMQVHIALIYCGVNELLKKSSNTKDVRSVCEYYKCLDGNFAANLKRDGFFSIDKGVNSSITLTAPGKDALRDYVKQLLNDKDE